MLPYKEFREGIRHRYIVVSPGALGFADEDIVVDSWLTLQYSDGFYDTGGVRSVVLRDLKLLSSRKVWRNTQPKKRVRYWRYVK